MFPRSRHRPWASPPRSWSIPIWLVCMCLISTIEAISFNPVPPPNLDLSTLGQVGLVGDFDAISIYRYYEQSQDGFHVNGSQSVLFQLPSGEFAPIAATDAYVHQLCPFVTMDGKLQGLLIAGNFTTVGGQKSQAVGLMDPSSGKVTALPGLTGKINAVYCDQISSTVYVGGDFKGGNSTNAIAWVGTTGWANLPFAGFNGPVSTIAKLPSGNMLFGGSFDAVGNSASVPTNQTGGNMSQVINLASGQFVAVSGSSAKGFDDPKNILCKTTGVDGAGNTWLLGDATPGSWEVSLRFGFRPSKLRLWNTKQDGRGTKTFRFISAGGIMNMTYTDPTSREFRACDSQCPLEHTTNAQEFTFVNSIGMSSFSVEISDWYGLGGGLNGIELVEAEIWTHAINEFNEPSCAASQYPGTASLSSSAWITVAASLNAAALRSDSDYIHAEINSTSDPSIPAVTFKPDVNQSGNYSVILWTPGCLQDNSCGMRGIVNITVDASTKSGVMASKQTLLYQTNAYDKYDEIYTGYVDASTSGFRPTITLSAASGQQSVQIVAQKLQMQLLSTLNLGSLNGLYEYNPTLTTASTNYTSSAIDRVGMNLTMNAQISASVVDGDDVYIAGNFSTAAAQNFVHFNPGGAAANMAKGGLNQAVEVLYFTNSSLYVGGYFTNTADNSSDGLSHAAIYDTKAHTYTALGAGVNGRVCFINPMLLNITTGSSEPVVVLSGDFDTILAFNKYPALSVQGLAVWVPSQKNWLQNLPGPKPALGGKLTASSTLPGGTTFFAGTLVSQEVSAQGAVGLGSDNDLSLKSLGIQPKISSALQNQKVVITNSSDPSNTILSGVYNVMNGQTSTILGGHFAAQGADGSTVNNLALIDGSQNNAVRSLASSLDENSTFVALAAQNAILYAGGNVTGRLNDSPVNGLAIFDLGAGKPLSPQPPMLSGQRVTIQGISVRPNSNDIYVAGAFDKAGSLDCPGLCVLTNSAWVRPGSGFTGVVTSMWWTSERQLIVGGSLMLNSTKTNLASYDSGSHSWQNMDPNGMVPGPVNVLTSASEDASKYWVAGSATNGSAYILMYDGQTWYPASSFLNSSSIIQGLQILPVSQTHDSTPLVDGNHVLLVTGKLLTIQYGQVSALLFNGTGITPFIIANSGYEAGSIAAVFSQNPYVFTTGIRHLAVGFVVLISLAIALALVFLMVVGGILANYVRRRREGYRPMPGPNYQHGDMQERIPPSTLFGDMGPQGRSSPPHA